MDNYLAVLMIKSINGLTKTLAQGIVGSIRIANNNSDNPEVKRMIHVMEHRTTVCDDTIKSAYDHLERTQ